jgi:hypothetical protein
MMNDDGPSFEESKGVEVTYVRDSWILSIQSFLPLSLCLSANCQERNGSASGEREDERKAPILHIYYSEGT